MPKSAQQSRAKVAQGLFARSSKASLFELHERRLTVARGRSHADGDADVMFYETARIYRFLRTNPDHETALQRLRANAATGRPVRVRFLGPSGDAIESVRRVDD